MKYYMVALAVAAVGSHPVRGAWVEIAVGDVQAVTAAESHPVRGAWVEILVGVVCLMGWPMSHPVRGAWIEIKRPLALRKHRNRRTP